MEFPVGLVSLHFLARMSALQVTNVSATSLDEVTSAGIRVVWRPDVKYVCPYCSFLTYSRERLRYHVSAAPISVEDVVTFSSSGSGGVPLTYRCTASPFGSQPANLLSVLPTELWLMVFSFLDERSRRRLKFSCRRLREVYVAFAQHRRRHPPAQGDFGACVTLRWSKTDIPCNMDRRGVTYHNCVCLYLWPFTDPDASEGWIDLENDDVGFTRCIDCGKKQSPS